MRNDHPRLARIPDLGRLPRLRLMAVYLAVAALAFGAGAASARAATGGASGFVGSSASGGELAFSPFRYAGASWYGPGLWGRRTACGETLRPGTLGVANKTLPCGTQVKFVYHGRVLVTRVIDRGPYVRGRAWDLTAAASRALGLEGVGKVRYAVALSFARAG